MIQNKQHGFTLIELLIVIGIIGILAGIVLVTTNPAQQFGKANDAERKQEISSILKAVYQYSTAPQVRGALPKCLLGSVPVETDIPECDPDSSGIGVGNGGFEGAVELGTPANASTYDCSTELVPSYLREIPVDPDLAYTASSTGYYICKDTAEQIPKVFIISEGAAIYKDDGGCEIPGTTNPTMCISS